MSNALLIGFLIAHALVHVGLWAMPEPKGSPFDPNHSWLLGDRRAPAVALALIAAGALITGGVALWAGAGWWKLATAAGLGTSFVLLVLYFHRWFLPIQLVNAGLLAWLVWPALVRL